VIRSRVARLIIAAIVLATGVGAALQINVFLAQLHQITDGQRTLLLQIARVDTLASDLLAAEAAYVAPGQPDAPWLDRATTTTSELTATLAAVRSGARSEGSPGRLQAVADAMAMAATADASAREYLRQEQDLMAADVVFGEGRDAIIAVRTGVAALAAAENARIAGERSRIQQQLLLVGGGAGAIVAIGILVLTPLPRRRAEPAVVDSVPATGDLPLVVDAGGNTARLASDASAHGPVTHVIDLVATADLCTALSRVDSSAALHDMLARAAALLDASGIIVWLGSGDELFAATSHGYHPRVISSLGSIPREADNATADAWRTGEAQTVAGDAIANGAIVAPMFGPDACIGVLAAEVRHGREQDESTRAVTMMVAAQLATVLGAWPTPSEARAAEA
jgi:hypothetical protein